MKTQKPDIQGHRGCRGILPENTMPAFLKAVELGVDTLELDVAISKDNVVVVSHEPYMNPLICLDPEGQEIPDSEGEKYNLYQMTFETIKQFDCGLKQHPNFPEQQKIEAHKPALDNVFKVVKDLNPNIKFNIEIKAEPKYDRVFTPIPKEFVHLVLKVIEDNNMVSQTNLQSFDVRILEEIKKQSPNMPLALLVEEDEDIQEKIKQLHFLPEIISPYYKLLDLKVVKNLQAKNFKVIPWTVNTVSEMQTVLDYKVDGIITDYPDKLINLLSN